MKLYPFQDKLLEKSLQALGRTNSVLLQLCPGGGKTVIASEFAKRATGKNIRTWFICHRSELIHQTAKTFSAYGLEYGFIAAGYQKSPSKMIQICSIGSLQRRLGTVKEPGLMIFDECHHLGAGSWTKVKNHYPNAYTIGLSGTPHRLDGKGLGHHFNEMVVGPSPSWLIENGFLAEYDFYMPSRPDIEGVHKLAGDYNQHEIDEVMGSASITGNVIDTYGNNCLGKRAILFSTSIKRSRAYAEDFKKQGVNAVHMDGKTDKSIRREMSRKFAAGEIDVLCNVNLFGEGYDLSAQAGVDCPVQVVLDCAPSLSLSKVLQAWYRSLRKQEGRAMIFDFSGNCVNADGSVKHGLPDDDREWSLEGAKKKTRAKSDEPYIFIRQCPAPCFYVSRNRHKCPKCGREFQIQERVIDEVEGELAKVDKDMIRRKRKIEQGGAKTLSDLIALGRRKNYKSPERWAGYIMEARRKKASRA